MDSGTAKIVPIERVNLRDLAYEQLRDGLARGVYQPGEKFTVRGVSKALGSSSMPARSALERLTAEGVLVPNATSRVLEVPPLSKEHYQELMSIRLALEYLATKTAAERVTKPELAIIAGHLQSLEKAALANDLTQYLDANFEFHFSVYRASGMDRLLRLIEQLWTQIGPYVSWMMEAREALISSIPTHRAIFDALAAGDGDTAANAIRTDISTSGHALIRRLPSLAQEQE